MAQPPALVRNPHVQDAILALVLAGLAFAPGFQGNGISLGQVVERPLDGFGVALGLLQCLPLAARRRWAGATVAVVGLAFATGQLLGYPPPFSSIGLFIAIYSAGAHQRRLRLITTIAGTFAYAGCAVLLTAGGSPEQPLQYVSFFAVLVACWVGGDWMRSRARLEAERRQAAAEAAVVRERSRIARELHDVVTHHVTAMVVQSDSAQFVTSPDEVRSRLENVSETGRRALADLRQLLDVLPGRSSASLTDLIEQVRSTGQPVEFTVTGTPEQLADGAELALYRVVQEGLTNAMKHAAGQPTRVGIDYDATRTEVTVSNDGPVVITTAGGGHGLSGLRDRVAGFGGDVEAGPLPEGGFRMRVTIPAGGDR